MSSTKYSYIAVVLLIIGELSIALWQHCALNSWQYPAYAVAVAAISIVLIDFFRNHHQPNVNILANLVSSTIAPSWLGVAFLLAFIANLSWLIDIVIEFFKPASETLGNHNLFVLLVLSIVGLIVTCWFFPESKLLKREEKISKVVFFSGISLVPNSINKETGVNDRTTDYDKFNLIPLVRILQEFFLPSGKFAGMKCKLMILSSNANEKVGKDAFFYPLIDLTAEKSINTTLSDAQKEQFSNRTLPNEHTALVIGESNLWIAPASHFPEGDELSDEAKHREEMLRNIIKDAALLEFPDKCHEIEDVEICFTDSCDFDIFTECYDMLSRAVASEDRAGQMLCFNLSPGTGIVSSLMTLFSIDADRRLFYYAQYTDDYTKNEQRVQEANKSQIPLESLLSQAIQKINPRY